jgi:hypothetical protein
VVEQVVIAAGYVDVVAVAVAVVVAAAAAAALLWVLLHLPLQHWSSEDCGKNATGHPSL